MALSDRAVRQAKATGTAYTLGDIDELSLNVSAHGGKSWHFRYYWLDKQKRLSLGAYPEISLRKARQAHTLWAKGLPPKFHRQQERLAARLAGENTFSVVCAHGMERRKREIKTGKGSTHARIVRVFEKNILPFLDRVVTRY
jgi:hypothetical protein